ncbi:MAG: RNA polymerase sporulation sigma factor SigK [Firmicutes bacterium]|nr:RNA polymerase sporulation sigma factor SigK [Bacillota bacterium]
MLLAAVAGLAALVLRGVSLLVSYITGSHAFPKPLTEDEEREYLKRRDEGDDEARNTLIERNLRLVAHIVKKFENTGESVEDLISIGTIGLIKAIRTFDMDKNTRLATYAARCIENEILMYLRATKRIKSEAMLHEPIGSDREGNEINLMDILEAKDQLVAEAVESRFEEEKLREKLKCLTPRERKVIEMRYGLSDSESQTQREIASALKISRSYVSRIEKRAISKLLRAMNAEGYW